MLKIKEAIIVEGTYDKIKLCGIVDATIITTEGFNIYHNRKKALMIKKLAEKTGIIILTDSDRAGFQIRNFIKNIACNINVKHAYIPDIKGKEKRKTVHSKEGFLGVEGIDDNIIIEALKSAQFTPDDSKSICKITKSDLFSLGLSGNKNSNIKRDKLTKELGLPQRISANMLLDVLNTLYSYDDLKKILES